MGTGFVAEDLNPSKLNLRKPTADDNINTFRLRMIRISSGTALAVCLGGLSCIACFGKGQS
ncbi:hypothetical protein BJ508DRAFT_101986 [Ascobolus immersus RN42]|uniref:Uncharacterized protein n=1 Tax=Ascobolus immersus RN42 TaxID=1160509 RepID=A0A3N4HE51_ASCIM|nr:hypothetical protein BJ508DRAFT_101986 [Ascobolus immersus RN42]